MALGLWVSRSPCSSLAGQDVLAALKKFSLYLEVAAAWLTALTVSPQLSPCGHSKLTGTSLLTY